jgi:hypothetical protein
MLHLSVGGVTGKNFANIGHELKELQCTPHTHTDAIPQIIVQMADLFKMYITLAL